MLNKLFSKQKLYTPDEHKKVFDALASEMEEIARQSAKVAEGLVLKANGHMPKEILEGMGLKAGLRDGRKQGTEH